MTNPTTPAEPSPDALLVEAVRTLTAAARAGWDWAEFVALACAGAAANVGGIEEILSQRSGSWEASFVRSLLVGTVSEDETYLWERRTEPVTITLNVDDLLSDIGDRSFVEYDEASAELDRRAEAAAPPVDTGRYAWVYRKNPAGEWTGEDPAAPPWSRDTWRAGVVDEGIEPDDLADLETTIDQLGWPGALLVPRYPGALADLTLAEQAGEDAAAPYLEAQVRLENQRLQEQRDFGEALADRIRAAAVAILPGLTVPVEITVLVDSSVGAGEPAGPDPVARRLLDAVAFSEAGYPPIPSDLPGTPLQRLGIDDPTA